jgi:deferrochelatase/peroxidase EfeB
MKSKSQEGIYCHDKSLFKKNSPYPNRVNVLQNKSFGVIFLKVSRHSKASQVAKSLAKLWRMYKSLQLGMVEDLPGCHVPSGRLTTLIGYGENIFKLDEVKKRIPIDFEGKQFLASPKGGEPILKGSGITYSKDIHENVGITEDIIIQFIADTQLAVYRAIVESWKILDLVIGEPLHFTKFYTGFRRDDGRSWLGFHDEVSNMNNAKEREAAIFVDVVNNRLLPRDFWTAGGTYLCFLRTAIDLEIWHKLERTQQELIIGRNKLTGYPVVGVDKNRNPITTGRNSIAQQGRFHAKKFRDHPDYFKMPNQGSAYQGRLDVPTSLKVLNQTHIGRTRHITKVRSSDPSSRRIFRQGFEFLESTQNDLTRPLTAGLNFVSFQNDPGRLFFILTDPHWLGKVNFGGDQNDANMAKLFSVLAAGVFFVPKLEKPFPGAKIFI